MFTWALQYAKSYARTWRYEEEQTQIPYVQRTCNSVEETDINKTIEKRISRNREKCEGEGT